MKKNKNESYWINLLKTDAMISDDTGTIRLELWENAIDQVQRGKSYLLKNLKVKIFDDKKYVNTC